MVTPPTKSTVPAPLKEAVVILGSVSVWNEEVVGLIRQKFPKLQFAFASDKATLRAEVEKFDVSMVICQGETDADLSESFLYIKAIYEFLDRGTAIFGIYTNRVSNPSLQVFEKRKLLRRYSPWSTVRAIPLHLESALLDLRRAHARYQKAIQRGGAAEPLPDLHSPREPIAVVDDTVEEEVKHETKPAAPEAPRRVDSAFDDIVLISTKIEDLLLCTTIAKRLGANFHLFTQASHDIQKFLANYPDAAVFWDVDYESINVIPMLLRSAKPYHVFSISDQPTIRQPFLSQVVRDLSLHSIIRRNDGAAQTVYAHLTENIFNEIPLGLSSFFTAGSRRNIQLTSSDHRSPALAAMRKFLTHGGMSPRLGNLVEQACDELLLNAIYHAPVDHSGRHYQANKDKSQIFAMQKSEEVTISLMSNEHYFGICVIDNFGSLNAKQVLENLTKNQTEGSVQLGLFKILDSGFSLLLNVIPGQLTEAMIFFPKAASHKEFKSGFRFFSLRSGKPNLPPNLS